jgi:hypothetical protein
MSRTFKTAAIFLVAGLALTSGCVEWLLPTTLASAAGGWLLRDSLPTPAEYTCYRNGAAIDCSDMPAQYVTGQQ